MGGRHNIPPLLESGVRVTCHMGYPVPILIFLGLSVLDLGPMYATHRQTSDRPQADRRQTRIIAYCPYPRGGGINLSRDSGLFVMPTMHTTFYSARLFRVETFCVFFPIFFQLLCVWLRELYGDRNLPVCKEFLPSLVPHAGSMVVRINPLRFLATKPGSVCLMLACF